MSVRPGQEAAGSAPAASEGAVRLAAALDLAAAALPVIPLRGKVPRTPHGLTDASANLDTVTAWWRRWPGANVGIVTGAA